MNLQEVNIPPRATLRTVEANSTATFAINSAARMESDVHRYTETVAATHEFRMNVAIHKHDTIEALRVGAYAVECRIADRVREQVREEIAKAVAKFMTAGR